MVIREMNLMEYLCDCTCALVDWFKNVGHGTALESWYL